LTPAADQPAAGPFEGAAEIAAGATPLSEEEMAGLKRTYIATRAQLNAAEQENIAAAHATLFGRRRKRLPAQIIKEDFIKRVHRDMYGDVWSWAGTYRRSEKNIGIPWVQIPVEVTAFLGDVGAWLQFEAFPSDELAVRFHHRMVQIHLFPNGNGRHSRAMADLLILGLGGARFSWGGANLGDHNDVRDRYIAALQAADGHVLEPLIAFARS
jgi:Fic-DOC domain mobile mystery protein B